MGTAKSNASAAPPVQLQQKKQTWGDKGFDEQVSYPYSNCFEERKCANDHYDEDSLDKTSPEAKFQILQMSMIKKEPGDADDM